MEISAVSDELVPAVARAAAILDLVSEAKGASLTPSEIARELDLPKSSTGNICAALESAGLLVKRENGYTLGRKLVELGGRYLATVDPLREYYDLCRTLPTISNEASRVAILDGVDVLYLAKHEGYQPIRLTANIGDRFPASCTATGKILLSMLDPAQVIDRYRGVGALPTLTKRSVATVSDLMKELDEVRASGFAMDDEETTRGVTCFAVGVEGFRGDFTNVAVSATVLTDRLDENLREALLADLWIMAQRLGNPLAPRG
jgi:IclR family transcriptional regulator, blcABC operon repressor